MRLVLSAVTPAQLTTSYGLNAVSFGNGTIRGTGQGETIAIIGASHDPKIWSDLLAFDALNGLPDPYLTPNLPSNSPSGNARPAFSMVNFAGNSSNAGWNCEEALDVEMAHAAAPGANIVLVEARTGNLPDLIGAISAIKTLPSVSVISMSWGGPEFFGQQTLDWLFTTPAGHTGITYVASSGDTGAGAQWPASSPNVIGVGGTSLNVNFDGTRGLESAWAGSGGAISQVVARPGYQAGVISGANRATPDVAADSDYNTGFVIVSQGNQMLVGGTSMAAPAWAGLIAIADQGLAIATGTTMDGPTQALPGLYAAPAAAFYDVTSGSRASTGYDTSTGLGSPNAPTLVASLIGSSTPGSVNGNTSGGPIKNPVKTPTTTGGGTTVHSAFVVAPIPTAPAPAPSQPSTVRVAYLPVPLMIGGRSLSATKPVAQGSSPEAIDVALDSWMLG